MTEAHAESSSVRNTAREHLFPHFTKGENWYRREFPVIVRGDGCHVIDADGNRFVDGLAGLFCVNIGHGRQDIAKAASRQMGELAFWTNWSSAHPAAATAAALIAEVAPEGLNTVFFVSSGSEAVESAMKLALQYHLANGEPQRKKFIARNMAYHGTTLGALSMTGIPKYKEPFGPPLADVFHIPNTLGEATGDGGAASLPSIQAIRELLQREGSDTFAALFAEPVQNSQGALVPPTGYWAELRRICDDNGILLVADEVICGFGRIGTWFASPQYGAVPDMITFAKGSTSGYAALGGVIIRDTVAHTLLESPRAGSFTHGATWGGHPVATAVAAANITAIQNEKVLDNVARLEPHFQATLNQLVAAHPSVKEWRGAGYFYAIELMGDRRTGRPLRDNEGARLLQEVLPAAMRRASLITRGDDRGGTMIALAPPLVADAVVLDELFVALDRVLDEVDTHVATLR